MPHKTLIKQPFIVSNILSFGNQKGSVFIEGNRITHMIREHDTCLLEELSHLADDVIEAENDILIPGMVNSHYHSYTNVLKGTVNKLPLELWTLYTVAYGHALEEEDVYLSALVGCIEMMKAGVTSCVDHFPHIGKSEAALSAYEESGMRVAFAPMMHDVPDEEFFEVYLPDSLRSKSKGASPAEMKRFYRSLLSTYHKRDGRMEIQLGPNAPQRCSPEMLDVCRDLSETEGLRVHTHLLETKAQRLQGDLTFEDGVIGHLDRAGLINEQLSVAHAVWLTPSEIELLQDSGVTSVHNPASNLVLGSGIAPIHALKKGEVALGTDGSNCGTNQNLFEAMRLTALIHRVNQDYSFWLGAEDVFRMGTTSGARVLGKENELGRIVENDLADLVLLNEKTSLLSPLNDSISQLVYQENGSSVKSVMVNGRWTVKEGKLLTIDEEKVLRKVSERREAMMNRCREPLVRANQLRPYFEEVISNYNFQ
ncbi:amidohydrolase family protein [Guptibacillus algicola]|uniref:amidohydrolase family protein n=1 Tax=Guptibacillus algicola TaxID=225844 RepID=UPI001CD775EF|nr:amidohydrolase family protein [Alkalihalobacillus algicola]MCA0987316.1 amidohydrolase family protein [Alkalihalobacillus algicola]